MRWIGLHLPELSLEALAAALPGGVADAGERPIALVDDGRIAGANAAARARGVLPGLQRVTAQALVPQLVLGQADAVRDAQALRAVAHVALAFTPSVTWDAPQGVLLEVAASLRYFGGLRRLAQRLRQALAPLGHTVWMASAPTAQGAAWLSRLQGDRAGRHCADLAALGHALDAAPVGLLQGVCTHPQALEGMGLRTLHDLRRLPRQGLARRFGQPLLDALDRARGDRPDPRTWLTLPQVFEAELELWVRADTAGQVLHGAGVLLERLIAWARARQVQVRRFSLQMRHEPRHRTDAQTPPASVLVVALAEPSHDADHLLLLLRERLAALQLAAPTLSLGLHCDDVAVRAPPNTELFPTARSEREGLVRLIERLQARLGPQQIQRLARVADHRPECTSPLQPAEGVGPRPGAVFAAAGPLPVRPVWLLAQPEALPERASQPWLAGRPLQLLCGPERIEAGWWDAGLAQRDYFIAQAGDGALVWVYRDRVPVPASATAAPGWYLQGRFG